jgi:hypothetical protein
MKTITFKNRFNGERVVCNDTRAVQVIDGIEYLLYAVIAAVLLGPGVAAEFVKKIFGL